MNSFPAKGFWNNVIIVRSWSFDDSKKGKLLEGIKNDQELMNCMKDNGISIPNEIKEIYIELKSNDRKKMIYFNKF